MGDEKPDRDGSRSPSNPGAPAEVPSAFAFLLTASAGFLDAVGYIQLGNLYVSFMSGNSTGLGLAIVRGDTQFVIRAVCVISSFIFGAFVGTLLIGSVARRKTTTILLAEAALLIVAVILIGRGSGFVGLLPVCVAMGVQNVVHRTVAGADVGKSFVTGVLFGVGQSLAHLARGRSGRARCLVYGGSWVCFVAGVSTGGAILARLGFMEALLIGCFVLIALATAALIYESRGVK